MAKELARTGLRIHSRLADSEPLEHDTCPDVLLISTQCQLQPTESQRPLLEPELRMKGSKVQVTGQVTCARASRESRISPLEEHFPEGSSCFKATELT